MDVSSSARPVVSSPGKLRQFMRGHALLCYFVMAYGFSWVAWLPYILSLDGFGLLPVHLTQLGILPGAYLGPCLSGFLMTAATEGRAGIRCLLSRFVLWRVRWYWYLVALCGIPLMIIMGFLMQPGALGSLHPDVPQLLLFFPLLLIVEILTSGLAEEPGWRGFALPRLQRQYGSLLGSVILGILWGCWHLPLFLTAWQQGTSALGICEFVLGTVSIAIIISWIFNHTRESLLIAILVHATVDAFTSASAATGLFTEQWMLKYEDPAVLAGFGLVALVLVVVTRGRLGYQQVFSPPDEGMSAFDDDKTIPLRN